MEDLFLIVGLGNPGAEYARTRHNVGFMAVEEFARRRGAVWKDEPRFESRLAKAEFAGRRLWLCEPMTYMNASGAAVGAVCDYFKIGFDRLAVVVDDADLELGEIRMRPHGGTGGHHGLESLHQHLGTANYARLRIGIGRQAPGAREITGHVLGRFAASELDLLKLVLERAVEQLECWLSDGIEKAMCQFNGVIKSPTAKES